ncbi:rod shape-determining protein MreC [Limisalsivibrio acetivorans]|uniref:rod shape-determining protein MreC n=1 Tax=Limisalsivibrio acetivorans TaxID=1304888 RepID=UPI0003B34C39|nr:rod shape-determining protein MreC [Limisalsivibrio acetivorans]
MLSWKKLAAILAFIFFLVILQVKNPDINGPFKGILGNILNPFVYYTSKTTEFAGNVWNGYINLVNVRRDNVELREDNGRLRLQNSIMQEKVLEYERLKKLLNFKDAYQFDTIACNVVGRNIEGYVRYIRIDRGSADGVKVNDPVISFNGLVGVVTEVDMMTARVDVLLNIVNNVSVMNKRTRSVGIIRGDGAGKLTVDYYDRLDDAKLDDLLITSGLGGVYPKGIAVGRIFKLFSTETGLYRRISVSPVVDFFKLENVLVVSR